MFEGLEIAPSDPILGLTEAYEEDPNPDKINLSAGIYQDQTGATPILRAVKKAEARLLERETSKSYLGIPGLKAFRAGAQELLFGAEHEIVKGGRAVTVQTPGGTAAVRVAADFLKRATPRSKVWMSDPTWVNHGKLFEAAGFETRLYPYFDAAGNRLDFDAMMAAMEKVPAGDIFLMHGCCHNPSGIDPSPDQWERIATTLRDRRLIPLFDFAYQGFGDGLREDTNGIWTVCADNREVLIAQSFSKNFGLYNERVGALTAVTGGSESREAVMSHIKAAIRAMYSSPPSHGAATVATVLGDPELQADWRDELDSMRSRIHRMRHLFARTLRDKGAPRDFSFITEQRGMFSFSGLNKSQVEALRTKYGIYIVGSGRINIAGLSEANMDVVCGAIVEVLSTAAPALA